jgi:hypothetical protein
VATSAQGRSVEQRFLTPLLTSPRRLTEAVLLLC